MEIRKQEPSDSSSALGAGTVPERAAARPLTTLAIGEAAVVDAIDGDPLWVDRVRELGLCPGTSIVLERRAPLGDPLVFHFRGTRLAMRAGDANAIQVRPLRQDG